METKGDAYELERELADANKKYHETGDSPLTDDEYDAKLERLADMNPDSLLLHAVGFSVRPKDAVDLPRRMGSLEKKRTDEQLRKALASHPKSSLRYVLSDKLDGQSALLHAPPKGGLKMYSRGDGIRGRDISRFVTKIDGIPKNTVTKMRNMGIEFIRGELVAPKNAKEGLEGSLLRNFVTGVINSKTPLASDLSKIRFVAYEVCGEEGCQPPSIQLATASKLVKYVVHHGTVDKSDINSVSLADTLIRRKSSCDYGMDGIVLVVDKGYVHDNTVAYPSNAFAFKSPLAESGTRTKISGISWRLTRHGRFAPTLLVDEVTLNGSKVGRASGKNAKYVVDNGLGIGAEVELVMAGDVIPDVRKIIKRSADIPSPPTEYRWDANRINYVSQDTNPADKLAYMFATLPIKGFGDSAGKKLVDSGYLDVFDILSASPSDLNEALGGDRGGVLQKELKSGLFRAKRPVLAAALGVFPQGIGKKTISAALDSGHRTASKLQTIDGIGEATGKKIETGLARFFDIEAKLGIKHRDRKTSATSASTKKRLTVVFTGVRVKELEEDIENAGGRVVSSVNESTDYLVTKDGKPPSTIKGKKAIELGVPTITPATLRDILGI